jgi:hypothetical protein
MAAMLAANVPGRDLAFEIAVLARIERRRFVREQARNLGAAALAALLLALVMPRLYLDFGNWGAALSGLTGNVLVMVALLVAASAIRHFRPAANAWSFWRSD